MVSPSGCRSIRTGLCPRPSCRLVVLNRELEQAGWVGGPPALPGVDTAGLVVNAPKNRVNLHPKKGGVHTVERALGFSSSRHLSSPRDSLEPPRRFQPRLTAVALPARHPDFPPESREKAQKWIAPRIDAWRRSRRTSARSTARRLRRTSRPVSPSRSSAPRAASASPSASSSSDAPSWTNSASTTSCPSPLGSPPTSRTSTRAPEHAGSTAPTSSRTPSRDATSWSSPRAYHASPA